MPKKGRSEPRPQPTHFLCLPLLTPLSTPQLAKSLAHLRATTSIPDSSKPTSSDEEGNANGTLSKCVIPDSAYRPLGTLHLTLGVMSLPSSARLAAALKLLDDLNFEEILKDSEKSSASTPYAQGSDQGSTKLDEAAVGGPKTLKRAISPPPLSTRPNPMTVSLVGLSAFPSAEKATVLHASPYDPTSRLYPFSLALRQRFIDAGFLEAEKRELVLHATLVNTVYAKGASERRNEGGRRGRGKVVMEVKGLLRLFTVEGAKSGNSDVRGKGDVKSGGFVWADGIEIDRVRICKMGARKIEDEVFGQEYEIVGEKTVLENDT